MREEGGISASPCCRAAHGLMASASGAALGLGFNLAFSCDLIVAAEGASVGSAANPDRCGRIRHGAPGGAAGLGVNRGYEAIITGRILSAQELDDWGSVRLTASRRGVALRPRCGETLDRRADDRA